jgi:hypothetical protein
MWIEFTALTSVFVIFILTFKKRTVAKVEKSVLSPHPALSQRERGNNFILLPSPSGRRGGDEGNQRFRTFATAAFDIILLL